MKAINCQVITVAGYIMNVCNLVEGDLVKLDMIVKIVLQREGFHEKFRDYLRSRTKKGGRGLKSFKEVMIK